jgi:hypothetical protein
VQYVRCDACGAKAILAASRCPKCTEALALRDHHGVLLPLSHCRKCDTYYLSSKGGCKWCGTKPRASVNWSRVAVAVAGFIVASGALWWGLRPRQPSSGGDSAVAQQPAPVSAPAPPVDSGITRDSAVSDSPVAASDSALAVSRPLADSASRAPTPTPVDVGSAWPAAFVLQGRATVSNYANVRAEPVPGARVLAVLAPGVRVEIGGRYRGWRLIRTEGAMGWVDPRNLRLDAAPTR